MRFCGEKQQVEFNLLAAWVWMEKTLAMDRSTLREIRVSLLAVTPHAQIGLRLVARKTLEETPVQYRGWEWGYLVNTAWPKPDDSPPLTASDFPADTPASAIWKDSSVRVVQGDQKGRR